MVSLSVADVSGMIAAGVFLLQLIPPIVLPAILIAFITNKNSVVTWSVLGRHLHSSYWPSILRTETAASSQVSKPVVVTGHVQFALRVLLSIASIVTPLGLYQSIQPANSQTTTVFSYLPDRSAFGFGTPPRTNATFARICQGNGGDAPCPGTPFSENCTTEGLVQVCNSTVDYSIPIELRDLFVTGAADFSPSVSSIFDMQWRTYVTVVGGFLTGKVRPLSVLILDESIQLVEGLIVDMVSGGIGFRNHTGPVASSSETSYGSTWKEDILFVEPETQCVNLNITLDFSIDYDIDPTLPDIVGQVLTDRGGFSQMQRPAPSLATATNGQGDLSLQDRAYRAAWLNNFYTLAYFNATDPDPLNITRIDVKEGQTFDLSTTINFTVFQAIRTSINYGEYLVFDSNTTNSNNSIRENNFITITDMCAGSVSDSPANIDSSIVGCSLLYGPGGRTDGGNSLIPDQGSKWSVPIYSCASAIRTNVRTVTFAYSNGTGLDALSVTSAVPKAYADVTDAPRWAVENLADFSISEAQPTWGILGTSNSTVGDLSTSIYNMSTLVSDRLYLPGYMDEFYAALNGPKATTDSLQNLPGVDFYRQSLYSALTTVPLGTKDYQGQLPDYSGQTSLALYAKWQNMSQTANNTAGIINLIWTDLAANTVVGTKGWGLTADSVTNSSFFIDGGNGASEQNVTGLVSTAQVPITLYQSHILYHLPYAVPAIIILAAILVILATLAVLLGQRRTGRTKMRQLLDGTAAGRIMTLLLWPKEGEVAGKEWIKNVQKKQVRITNDGVFPEDDHKPSTVAVASSEKPNEPNVAETTPEQEEQEEADAQNDEHGNDGGDESGASSPISSISSQAH